MYRDRVPIAALFAFCFVLTAVIYRGTNNALHGLSPELDVQREVIASAILSGAAALLMVFWGSSKALSSVVAICTVVILFHVPLLLLTLSNQGGTWPILTFLWSFARMTAMTLIALVPVYWLWPRHELEPKHLSH